MFYKEHFQEKTAQHGKKYLAKITLARRQRFVESACERVTDAGATTIPGKERGDSKDTGRQQHGYRVEHMRQLKLQRSSDAQPANLPDGDIVQDDGDEKTGKNRRDGEPAGLYVSSARWSKQTVQAPYSPHTHQAYHSNPQQKRYGKASGLQYFGKNRAMVESRMSPVSGQCPSEPDGILHRHGTVQAVLVDEEGTFQGRGGPGFVEGERWSGKAVWQETHEEENAAEAQEYSAPIRRRSCSHEDG
jgi:hypothetical protein